MATIGGRQVLASGLLVLSDGDNDASFDAAGVTYIIQFDEDQGGFRCEPISRPSQRGGDEPVITLWNCNGPGDQMAFGRLATDSGQVFWSLVIRTIAAGRDARVVMYSVSQG